jgi:hypothetical protein
VTLNLQVAYFLQSAEMASDDKFEEKMKVDSFNPRIPASLLIFPHRTSVLSLPILLLKIESQLFLLILAQRFSFYPKQRARTHQMFQ